VGLASLWRGMKKVGSQNETIAKKSGAKDLVRANRKSLERRYQEVCDLRRRLKLAAAQLSRPK
jgi:hypothetical protein